MTELLDEELKEVDNILGGKTVNLEEAKEVLKQSRISLAGLKDATKRKVYEAKIVAYERKIPRLELLGQTGGAGGVGKVYIPTKDEGTKLLEDSLKILVETEDVAKDTVKRLGEQREKEKRIIANLKGVDQNLSQGLRLTTKIERRNNPFSWLSWS